jgi:uncharacterized protein with FMN-binding domain
MAQASSNGKVANSLVTASFGAIIAVYSAGYMRTQAASERFASRIAERRAPQPGSTEEPVTASAEPSSATQRAVVQESAAVTEPKTASPGTVAVVDHAANPSASPQPAVVANTAPSPAVAAAPAIEAPPAVESKAEVLAPIAAAPTAPPRVGKWKDGTYRGWGYSRHGDIEAEVVIENGRILSAVISDCQTRYSCSVIDILPPQVAKRQSPDVDFVSGATQSADAFYGAVVEALGKAK